MTSGVSGLCPATVVGRVGAGAAGPAVTSSVQESPAFGSWEASFFDV